MKILFSEVQVLNDSYDKNILRLQKKINYFKLFNKLLKSKKLATCFFTAFLCILLSNSISAQTDTETVGLWQLKNESNGVKTYYQVSNCNNNLVFLLKVENSSINDIKVSWKKEISKSEIENLFSILIPSNKTLITTCEQSPVVNLKKSLDGEFPVSMLEAVNLLVVKIQSN